MYRKLLFHAWWRLAVSAIPLFLVIGGAVIYKAVDSSRHDLGRYRSELRNNEKCADATANRPTERDLTDLKSGIPFIMAPPEECIEPPGVIYNIRKHSMDAFALWIAVSLSIFLVLTSISLYIGEKVVGWKRLSIVVASGLGLASLLITIIYWSSLRGDDAGFALLLSCAAFPIGVLLVLGGRFTTKWVRAGFAGPAEPINRTAAEQKNDFSFAEERLASNAASTSVGENAANSERDKIAATPLASPWRRFWARSIDIWVLSLPVGFGLGIALTVIDVGFGSALQKQSAGFAIGWVCFPAVMFAEAIVFGVFGNTPGKALLGLRVTTVGGTKLSFDAYLSRLLGVYWFGRGTGFPIVSLFTMIKQYQRLKLGREARYDSGRFNVRGHPLGWFRIALAVAVVFLLLVMIPGMLIELARESAN